MVRHPPRPTRTDTLFPYTTPFRSNEEHALARTERKSGRGHRGFVVDADPSVTLEEDLGRRDFIINAIAQDADGNLVDPLGRSEEHTSELQSLMRISYAVFCLKKKNNQTQRIIIHNIRTDNNT